MLRYQGLGYLTLPIIEASDNPKFTVIPISLCCAVLLEITICILVIIEICK